MNPAAPTALIAEDEPLLAAALQHELAKAWPELRVVATVGDGASAVREALRLAPDVLLLDIRMPGMSGLDAAAELADAWDLAAKPFPALAFVTAYDQYAVQAFEAQALDYVLKPVQPARLQKSVQKLRRALDQQAQAAINSEANKSSPLQATAEQLRQLLAALEPAAPTAALPVLRQLPVSPAGAAGNTIRMVPVSEVLAFDAADKYLRVLTAQAEYLIRTPLKDILPQLDPADFWQIHRGTVVRAEAIDLVERDESGRLHLRLRGTTERFVVSRLYATRFRAL